MTKSKPPTPANATRTEFEIEAPQARQARFIRLVCRLTLLLTGLLALLCVALSLLVSWQSWGVSALAALVMVAVAAFDWWLVTYRSMAYLAAWLNMAMLTTVISLLYWQAPYFVYYLAFIFILTVTWLTLGRKQTLFIFGLLLGSTLLYSVVNDNHFYAPDEQPIKLDYGSFAIWWLTIGAIIWMFSFLYDTLQRDNMLLNRQTHQLKLALQELELRQAERLKAEEALRVSQAQLLQSQKMESVGRLAGGVAHDFNNLLTAILGYTELIRLNLSPSDELYPDITEIESAANRAASLTRQLLAFSRQQVLQPQLLDLNEVVLDMHKLLKRLLGEDIELNSVLAPLPAPVWADRGQIEQVLMNLAVNARDAMPEGGQLTIEIGKVELDPAFMPGKAALKLKPGEYVLLTVSDTGLGMDEQVQAHIFEPFFTTKEVGSGTGLGLATCQGIVEQSGGAIEVYSSPKVATSFKIYLPVASETGKRAESVVPVGLNTLKGSETIMVVEDEDAVRTLISRVLSQAGYKVLDVEHGLEALTLLEENSSSVDLVLTDLIMPKMGGMELVEKLRQWRPDLHVIGMSGYTDRALSRINLFKLVDGYVQKPFTPLSLLNKIREILDRSV